MLAKCYKNANVLPEYQKEKQMINGYQYLGQLENY
jgi:hypothetical protein